MTISKKAFATRLCELMEEQRLTNCVLAEKSGIAPSNISTYVTGHSVPREKSFIKLADTLGVSVDYLKFGNGTKYLRTCKKCGTTIKESNSKFCHMCGCELAEPLDKAIELLPKLRPHIYSADGVKILNQLVHYLDDVKKEKDRSSAGTEKAVNG